jgi:hypothetical protein
MKPVKVHAYDGHMAGMESLELLFRPCKRTIKGTPYLFPELNFKVPYHEIDNKFYLTGGLCYLSVVHEGKEYLPNIHHVYRYNTVVRSDYYEKFKEKFNVDSEHAYCYSLELHNCVMEFGNINDLKNWFGNNFFYGGWACLNPDWANYKIHDHEFMKFITSNFEAIT